MNGTISRKHMLMGVGAVASALVVLPATAKGEGESEVILKGGWQSAVKNKHIPVVEVRRVGDIATVRVEVKHPQKEDHHINAIRIYDANRLLLCEQTLNPTRSYPAATFELMLASGVELTAVSDCNLHGLWMKSFTI